MDKKTLKEYAELMKEYNLASLEIEEDGYRVKLEKRPKPPKGHPPADMPYGMRPPMGPPPAMRPPEEGRSYPIAPSENTGERDHSAPEAKTASPGETVKSPMVGIFYAAPAENAQPYVQVGSSVKKGDTICIIEAMKLMNEIAAERDGTITQILVENGAVVEYGTPLFVIE